MDVLDLSTWFLDAFTEFLDSIIHFLKIGYRSIMAIFDKSFYILRIISFKSAGSIVLHCGLELSKQLLVIHDIAKILRIIIKTIDSTDCLKKAVVLHSLVNV